MQDSSDTIFALASAPGRAGVAVLRLSGPGVRTLAQSWTTRPLPPPRHMARRDFFAPDGQVIDRGLLVWFPAPHSFTGEDVVECHLHGGPAILAAAAAWLGQQPGCRPAEAGEFTRRAFDHGKLDLAEAEGLADLIEAETEAQRRQALRQFDGALSHLYDNWRRQLIEASSLLEAAIDFADEADIPQSLAQEADPIIAQIEAAIATHLNDDHRGEKLRSGFHIAIVGEPNAGKSSLLNWLAQHEAAIVTPQAGTTRDVIEVRLDLGGYPVLVADTAGLRDSGDPIEREGIRRAWRRTEQADLILVLIDFSQNHAPEFLDKLPPERTWIIMNKIDLADDPAMPMDFGTVQKRRAAISVTCGTGLTEFLALLTEHVATAMGTGTAAPITRQRHRLALREAAANLSQARIQAGAGQIDLAAEDVRLAARALGRIVGRVDIEDILDRIFSEFCIGK